MAIDAVKTMFGYAVTCTGGTAVATVIENKGTIVNIAGITIIGAATTDIVTVSDFDGNMIFKNCALGTSNSATISFATPIRTDGLKVRVEGATTGWCTIFTE